MYLQGVFGEAMGIGVYDMTAKPTLLFVIELDGDYMLARTADGKAAVRLLSENGSTLSLVDRATESLSSVMELPLWYDIYNGAEYGLYLSDGCDLYGLDLETGERTRLLGWAYCGVGTPLGITPLGQNRFFVMDELNGGIYLLSEKHSDRPLVTLTLATAGGESGHYIAAAVSEFNRVSESIRVELLDYSVYNTCFSGMDTRGTLLLTTEIIAGNVPDMLDLSSLPASRYASKGMLENLYPFIDADPDMERADFFENIFRAMELDSSLYELTPTFQIETAAANERFLNGRGSLSMADVEAVMSENQRLEYAYGLSISRTQFLERVLAFNSPALVDWQSGECYFDSEFFIKALVESKKLPEEPIVGESSSTGFEWDYDESSMLASGKQLLYIAPFTGLAYMRGFTDRLGDAFTFVGFPCADGKGSAVSPMLSLGMSSFSEHKEECWQFLRGFLQKEGGRWDYLSIRRDVTERQGEDYLVWLKEAQADGYQISGDMPAAIQKGIALIESVDMVYRSDESIMAIIRDETAAYFAGDKSAEDCARLIQSRVSIYVAEQS